MSTRKYVLVLAAFFAVASAHAEELRVTVAGVHTAKGTIRGTLCNDQASFMRDCRTLRSTAPAKIGDVTLVFEGASAGTYAVSVFHDENDNGFPDIPPEGYAFGNDTQFPPEFDKAAIKVAGDTKTTVTLVYIGGGIGSVVPSASEAPAYAKQIPAVMVKDDGLVGEFYADPKAAKPLPAIIVLSGSDGSIDMAHVLGRRFADHGFAVLALAYWREGDLPKTLQDIPLEYFDKGIAWLARQKNVDPNRIGIIGWSKGAEAALLMASRDARLKATVALSPTHAVWAGINFQAMGNDKSSWSLAGKPLPYLRFPVALGEKFSISTLAENPAALIPIEKANGPILLVSGTEDRVWPASEMSDLVMTRLDAKGFKHAHKHLRYKGAGHAVFVGGPTGGAQFDPLTQMFGGTADINHAAWANSWPQVLDFLVTSLKAR